MLLFLVHCGGLPPLYCWLHPVQSRRYRQSHAEEAQRDQCFTFHPRSAVLKGRSLLLRREDLRRQELTIIQVAFSLTPSKLKEMWIIPIG